MNTRTTRIQSQRSLQVVAALVLIAAVLGLRVSGADAATGCGQYSFGFTDTRLLNDGISTSAGPFPIRLPAGTYDVTLESFDDHAAHPGQHEQTAEQFTVVLDSGWVSPPSADIPDDANHSVTVHTDQTIAESTAISVHHLGQGGINSLEVVCVGFTPAAAALGVTETPPAVPDSDETATPIDPLSLLRPAPAAAPTEPIDPLSLTRPLPSADIQPEVQGQIEDVPVLALTGPSRSATGALVGVTLIGLGGLLVIVDRRRLPVRS